MSKQNFKECKECAQIARVRRMTAPAVVFFSARSPITSQGEAAEAASLQRLVDSEREIKEFKVCGEMV